MGAGWVTEACTCSVPIEDCEGWRLSSYIVILQQQSTAAQARCPGFDSITFSTFASEILNHLFINTHNFFVVWQLFIYTITVTFYLLLFEYHCQSPLWHVSPTQWRYTRPSSQPNWPGSVTSNWSALRMSASCLDPCTSTWTWWGSCGAEGKHWYDS